MAFNNIDSLVNGKIVQIVFNKGVIHQGSDDTREWEQVLSMKANDPLGRETRFMLQRNLGYAAAAQYRNPGVKGRAFPKSQQASLEEFTAKLKEINTTIEIPHQLWERAQMAKSAKYLEPLVHEINNKALAQKRVMCFDFYADGTGVRGTAQSVNETNIAAGKVTVTLQTTSGARGHVGGFEDGDIFVLYQSNGTVRSASGAGAASLYGYKVVDRSFENATVTFELVDSNEAVLTNISATNLASGDVFYRVGQETHPNLSSISDYSTASEAWAGLESLAADDGRSVFGITMSGPYAGSIFNANGDPLDAIMFDKAMSKGKRRVGQSRYRYKKACMADEAHTQLVDSREADRKFMSIQDNKRGVSYFAYQHKNDTIECYTSEYVKKDRIWILPELKSGEKVLQWHGDDFKPVKAPGQSSEFMLKPHADGGYSSDIVSYMRGLGVLVAKHPAAIIGIKNFTITV